MEMQQAESNTTFADCEAANGSCDTVTDSYRVRGMNWDVEFRFVKGAVRSGSKVRLRKHTTQSLYH